MTQRTLRRILTLATLTLLSATFALAQTKTLPVHSVSRYDPLTQDWARAATLASPRKKLILVTLAEPTHRRACRIKSITSGRLICKSVFGKNRIYKPQEIAALIRPGDEDLRLPLFLGFNAGLGAAIWGTVVLAPVCIPCAAATAFAAYASFAGAGVTAYADSDPDALLYLAPAPAQTLQVKLH